jgi:hypothetical protein
MTKLKHLLNLIATSSIISLIIICIDFIIFWLVSDKSNYAASNLSLIVLLEGGLCFVSGSSVVLYSPWIAKIQEVIFQSKPYTTSKRKQIEKQMQIVITIGVFLILYGLIISFL